MKNLLWKVEDALWETLLWWRLNSLERRIGQWDKTLSQEVDQVLHLLNE